MIRVYGENVLRVRFAYHKVALCHRRKILLETKWLFWVVKSRLC